jgi:hypothetical protein
MVNRGSVSGGVQAAESERRSREEGEGDVPAQRREGWQRYASFTCAGNAFLCCRASDGKRGSGAKQSHYDSALRQSMFCHAERLRQVTDDPLGFIHIRRCSCKCLGRGCQQVTFLPFLSQLSDTHRYNILHHGPSDQARRGAQGRR